MNYKTLFAKAQTRTIEVALMGAGEFGASFLFQAQRTPGLNIRAVCNRTLSKAVNALKAIGIAEADITVCDDKDTMHSAFAAGKYVFISDCTWLAILHWDVLADRFVPPAASPAPDARALHCGHTLAPLTQ